MAVSDKRGQPYKVGWGKPPAASRFQPGRSGNPKGRPKQLDFATGLRRVLAEKVNVSNAGEVERLTIRQAILLRLRELVLKGDLRAQKIADELAASLPSTAAPDYPNVDEIRARVARLLTARKEDGNE